MHIRSVKEILMSFSWVSHSPPILYTTHLANSYFDRYLHAHYGRHRVNPTYPTIRARKRSCTCGSYRLDRRSEPQYKTRGVQQWCRFVFDETGTDEGVESHVGRVEEEWKGGYCWGWCF
jgi:hypothetical protein